MYTVQQPRPVAKNVYFTPTVIFLTVGESMISLLWPISTSAPSLSRLPSCKNVTLTGVTTCSNIACVFILRKRFRHVFCYPTHTIILRDSGDQKDEACHFTIWKNVTHLNICIFVFVSSSSSSRPRLEIVWRHYFCCSNSFILPDYALLQSCHSKFSSIHRPVTLPLFLLACIGAVSFTNNWI